MTKEYSRIWRKIVAGLLMWC